MTVSAKFRELVKAYAMIQIKYPNLKAITIAQWMHETGRGASDLFIKHNNAGGIKWRNEMLPYGKEITYQASDGPDQYVEFYGLQSFIEGYWAFINREPYKGWTEHTSTPEDYITFIRKCGYATDAEYVKKVLGFLPEAEALLREHTIGDLKRISLNCKTEYAANLFLPVYNKLTEALVALSPEHFAIEYITEPKPPQNITKRILIDPGHSELHSGAGGLNKDVQEEDLNRFQAELLKAELTKYGFKADIYDPDGDDLTEIGEKAKGHDMFISLHLNAYSKKQHYTCAMVHREVAKKESIKVASLWATAISNVIPVKLFDGTEGMPKGVMAAGLSVLRAAEGTNCPVCFLSEAFFVDAMDSTEKCKEWLKLAMPAGAKVVKEYFGV